MISLVGRRIFLALVTLFIISLILFMGVGTFPGRLSWPTGDSGMLICLAGRVWS